MMTQREAVFKVTTEVLKEFGVDFKPGSTVVKGVVTELMREKIIINLVKMFQNGEVELKATETNASKLNDSRKLKTYVGGLVTNWFTKDKLLNGNVKYEPKNTVSNGVKKTSSKIVLPNDDQLKDLNAIKKHLTNSSEVAQVEEAIKQRVDELNTAKVATKKPPVDLSKIPEEFKDLLS